MFVGRPVHASLQHLSWELKTAIAQMSTHRVRQEQNMVHLYSRCYSAPREQLSTKGATTDTHNQGRFLKSCWIKEPGAKRKSMYSMMPFMQTPECDPSTLMGKDAAERAGLQRGWRERLKGRDMWCAGRNWLPQASDPVSAVTFLVILAGEN